MTKQKRSKKEEQSVEEKTTLHGKGRNETFALLIKMNPQPCIILSSASPHVFTPDKTLKFENTREI